MKHVVLAALFLVAAGMLLAQGTSPLTVTGVQISPLPFKTGDTLTFKVDLKNAGTAAAGQFGYKVFLDVWANDVCVSTGNPAGCKKAWSGIADMTGSVPVNGTVNVTIPGSFKVTESATKYCFTACAIDPPNEFCHTYKTCAGASCTYNLSYIKLVRPLLSRVQGQTILLQQTDSPQEKVPPAKQKINFPNK